ncbi:MAG: PVC-type heme-binding CxxCH protein [Gemmatimonadota bacterium]
MKNCRRARHLLTLAIAGALLPQPLLGQDSSRWIHVLFLGHASTHHNSSELAPLLARSLAADGVRMDYTEDAGDLAPETLAPYNVLMVYTNHAAITPAQESAVLDFVRDGGGLVAIHAGGGAFKNSDAYGSLVGSRFLSHGTGTFTADVLVADHPVMRGIEPFATWDETYVHHQHNPDRIVLMERVDSTGAEPWTWVRTHGDGRVFYTAYGHDARTWDQPMFQRLVANAVAWTAGDAVLARIQANPVPPIVYSDDSPTMLIPGYVPPPGAQKKQVPLAPEASLLHWQVPPGFELRLFAAEPDIINPIAMAWDERGRLWVLETVDYPNDKQPDGQGNDVLSILEDTDGDGRADRSTTFADRLSIPTALVLVDGGVIVAQAPDFIFLADTNGDDVADVRRTVMTGWGTRDTHAGPSNLQYGPDNWIWGAVGYSGFEGRVGGEDLRFGAGVYRFRPDGSKLEFVASFTNNTFGLGFSENFDVFGSTANNEHSVFVAIPERYYVDAGSLDAEGRKKIDGHYALHPIAANTRQVDSQGGFTAGSGHNLYTARSFPREYWNRIAFVGEPTGNLIHRAVLEVDGSGFREVDGWNIMASRDEWASPIDARVGPDGAVWILDWYSFIKQHNTPWPRPPGGMRWETGKGNSYITPFRDRENGRVYRLVWTGADEAAADAAPLSLSFDRPDELVAALRHSNMFWRTTAQRLLVQRGSLDVAAALYDIIADTGVDEIGLNAPAVHAIWTLHGLGALDGGNTGAETVVRRALRHPAAGVRQNAVRALPPTPATFRAVLDAGTLSDADAGVRRHAFLALADQPAAGDVGRALYELGRDTSILDDEWLPTALFVAARRHHEGFLGAYAEEVGALEFARIAGRAFRGDLGDAVNLSGPALNDADWDELRVPAPWSETPLGSFTGVVWLRHQFEVPETASLDSALLSMPALRGTDVTYLNGVRIGATQDGPGGVRKYIVPRGALRAGRNVLAVQVSHARGQGGIIGEADSLFIAGADFSAPLAGGWKYRVEAEWEGGRRRDFTPGLPFAQQFLRFYNPVAGENGVAADASRRSGPGEQPDVTIALAAVLGQNRYDRSLITVQPGQRVAIAFDNTDDMLHNVVILERGSSVDEAGASLNAFLTQPAAADADYIPPALPVVAASRMVGPRESVTLTFTAPTEPGDYPFVCTFPGHWITMRGILRVGN